MKANPQRLTSYATLVPILAKDETVKTNDNSDKEHKNKDKDKNYKENSLTNKPSLALKPVSDFILISSLPEVVEWFPDEKRTPVTVVRSKPYATLLPSLPKNNNSRLKSYMGRKWKRKNKEDKKQSLICTT